jgi:peptidoglycan-N-acetylglucosamine deacetylase
MASAARLRVPAAAGVAAAAAWALPAAAPHAPPLAAALGIPRRAALDDAVGLTFDDGPHPVATPAVLEILAAHGATATFFVIGEQVRRTGALLAEIRAAGHAVAIHGDRHRGLLRLTPRALAEDLDRATATAGEPESGLHRAPYGVYSTAALRAVRRRGWTPLLWSRWGRDWRARATPGSVADEVTRDVAAGDVLLLHDADQYAVPGSWRATVAALPVVLERLAAAGLAARAVTAAQVRGAGR